MRAVDRFLRAEPTPASPFAVRRFGITKAEAAVVAGAIPGAFTPGTIPGAVSSAIPGAVSTARPSAGGGGAGQITNQGVNGHAQP